MEAGELKKMTLGGGTLRSIDGAVFARRRLEWTGLIGD